MSHQITIRKDGKAEFAFTGNRSQIWHNLGAELSKDAPIDTWKKEAGLDWEAFESVVMFNSIEGQHTFDDKRVLFRSDTKEPLSIVGKDYNIVQPGQVLEFFSDLVSVHGMTLSAAGSLFGGKRFWATCETGDKSSPIKGDDVKGFLLLVTSIDSTLATTAKFSSVRTVCNNTLTVALNEHSKVIKKSHRTEWDPNAVKLDMGLISESWNTFSNSIKKMAEFEVTNKYVREYFQNKFLVPGVPIEDQSTAKIKEVNALIDSYNFGAGHEYSKGTAWGIVNAVTDYKTHGTGKRDPSHQFWQSNFGNNDTVKTEVFNDMLALMA